VPTLSGRFFGGIGDVSWRRGNKMDEKDGHPFRK